MAPPNLQALFPKALRAASMAATAMQWGICSRLIFGKPRMAVLSRLVLARASFGL